MQCSNCGAVLPPKSRRCPYCGNLEEVDLRTVKRRHGGTAQRDCPRCRERMEVLWLELAGGVEIDRCTACHGIFFDPDELESLLDDAERATFEVDARRLEILRQEEQAAPDTQVTYLPCPDCGQLMNRRNFGARSGVIIDQCRDHGAWLDGGELRQLVEWTRAGGREHAARRQQEERQAQRKLDRMRRHSNQEMQPRGGLLLDLDSGGGGRRPRDLDSIGGVLRLIADLLT